MPRGPKPIFTEQECKDIRESFFDRNRRENSSTLARLYRCSTTTILKIVDGRYKPAPNPEPSDAKIG